MSSSVGDATVPFDRTDSMSSASPKSSQGAARRPRHSKAPSRGDQRERAILDAATQLLREVRFEDLNAERVANAAGISRTSLYFYFESMHDLLAAVIGRALREMIESIEGLGDDAYTSPVATLAAGLRFTCETWRVHGPIQKTALDYAHSIPAVHEHWRMLLERGITLYVALMQWAAKDAGRPPPQEAAARRHAELFMLMVGYGFYELFESPHTDDDEDQLINDLLLLGTRALELEPGPVQASVPERPRTK